MNKLNENYSTIDQMASRLLSSQKANTFNSPGPELSFKEILDSKQSEKTNGLKFSKHANQRLATRNINLSAEQMERLENSTTKAREKGIRESLVMVDDMAFIVNVKNNTVITAVGDSDGSIFTNIDGAVIG
ncbi:MAG TPA: flagellar protein [Lachnospiraceae bacterium]|nr:flagellar protein [Lachnospiraceae bacterium]